MAVNVVQGIPDPIKFVLTTGKDKDPVNAFPSTKQTLEILNRDLVRLNFLDSSIDSNVFFNQRTEITFKNIPNIFILELELHAVALALVKGENLIARLSVFDGSNPLGLQWKQFALNSR